MKVAIIVPGGVDRSGTHRVIPVLLWLIERLAREHDLHVFALYQEPVASRYDLLGASVHTIDRRTTKLGAFRAILAEHRRRPFDVFHAFWATPGGALAAVVGKLLFRPVLLHLAGGELVALPTIDYAFAKPCSSKPTPSPSRPPWPWPDETPANYDCPSAR